MAAATLVIEGQAALANGEQPAVAATAAADEEHEATAAVAADEGRAAVTAAAANVAGDRQHWQQHWLTKGSQRCQWQ